MVSQNNEDSVLVTYEDIKEALVDLEFKATSKYVRSGKFKYNMLVPR